MGKLAQKFYSVGILLAASIPMLAMPNYSQGQAAAKTCRYVNLKTLPISFAGRTPIIKGSINGKPVNMVIDTGAYATSILRNTVDKLKLKLEHTNGIGLGVGGETIEYKAFIKEMDIGPLHADRIKLKVIWDSGVSDSYGALLGADFLLQRDLEIALADESLKFFHPVDCGDSFLAYWDPNASAIDMEVPNEGDPSPVVTVMVNGQKIRAMIDTGAQTSVLNLAAAARLGITPKSPNVVAADGMSGIGKATASSWAAPIDNFTIGDESIKNAKIIIGDIWGAVRSDIQRIGISEWIGEQPEMILGIDFLRAHRVLFAASQRRLYFSYLGGSVFYTEHKQEAAWYLKSAERGNADAQYNLGGLYVMGKGVPEDDAQAVAWFRKAADQGYAPAQASLAHMLAQGKGAAKDYDQAISLYEKATSQDYVPAYAGLARVQFFRGDFAKSAANFRRAVESRQLRAYGPIWAYLATARSGDVAMAQKNLRASKADVKGKAWPAPLIDFHLADISSDALFKLAENSDAQKRKEQMCEAKFYIAEEYLLQAKRRDAALLLADAVRECPKNFVEYEAAVAELGRLGTKIANGD